MKPVIVPFFISHQGCPHQCVFCNQTFLNGSSGELPTPAEIVDTIRRYRESSGRVLVDVAFYGGTFTALPLATQSYLLDAVQPLINNGEVSGIRLSTRPDAVDGANAQFLVSKGVTLVELGAQSFDDYVLACTGRGYRSGVILQAVDTLRQNGLQVGIQLMLGLPGDTVERSLQSFEAAMLLRPDCVRLYPTVVIRDTRLAEMYANGEYYPLPLDGAVSLCKQMLLRSLKEGIPVIRMGVQPNDELQQGAAIVTGPYHPAFRQLVESELCYDLLSRLIGESKVRGKITIICSQQTVSSVVGQHRGNIVRLEHQLGVHIDKIRQSSELQQFDIQIESSGYSCSGNIVEDL